jgi:hypothetical protein
MNKYNNKILQTLVDKIETNYGINIIAKGRTMEKVHLFKIFCNYVRYSLKIKGKKLTCEQIGNFTKRNHATIVHACKSYDNLLFSDREFRELASKLESSFNKVLKNPKKNNLMHKVNKFSEKDAEYWTKKMFEKEHSQSYFPIMNHTFSHVNIEYSKHE